MQEKTINEINDLSQPTIVHCSQNSNPLYGVEAVVLKQAGGTNVKWQILIGCNCGLNAVDYACVQNSKIKGCEKWLKRQTIWI